MNGVRLLEGTRAALLVPGTLTLLQQAYPMPGLRARAFGLSSQSSASSVAATRWDALDRLARSF
ncbi:MAG: hypothetical protein M3171_01240 [Actinomycetota bacterium]|nr:hypothetical protein [Actinomycetota bacterium]